jgi:hypothetical protein
MNTDKSLTTKGTKGHEERLRATCHCEERSDAAISPPTNSKNGTTDEHR